MDLIQNTIVLNDFAHMKGLTTAICLILLSGLTPGSLMDFYFLSVSEDHNEYCHLNSNIACGQHQDQVLPAEGIVSAYHFMNQYVSEP